MPHWFYALMGNAAMALNLASFWMIDVRKLRWIAIASSCCFVAYSLIVPGGPLWIMAIWSVVFLLVNAYRLARRSSQAERHDPGCVCYGNWRAIVKETNHLIGRRFVDSKGAIYTLFGLVHGDDDYYYGMVSHETGRIQLLSCVGNIEGHGFNPAPDFPSTSATPPGDGCQACGSTTTQQEPAT